MESENLYQHHQQQQPPLVYSSLPSSSSTSPPRVSSTVQEWNPSNIVLGNGDEFNRYNNEILPNSREYFWPKSLDVVPSVKRSILEQDHDTKPCEYRTYVHPLQFDDYTPPKASLSDSSLKLCDTNVGILNNGYIENGQEQDVINLNQNLWISSFSDIGSMKQQKLPQAEVFAGLVDPCPPPSYMSGCSGSTTDHHQDGLFASTSLLPSSATTLPLPTHNMKGRNYDNEGPPDQSPYGERMPLGYSQILQSSESPSNSSNKTSTFRRDDWRKNKMPKPMNATSEDEVAKKPRVIPPHSSRPTLKVRKENLGDRITGLHRMVSPFGKTDTASVLTEAIGYIQFLQDQIQTLSMSYFRSSRNRWCQTTRGGRLSMKEWNKDEEEQKTQHLRSRGLCLVPLAFTSYLCSYNGSI